MRPEPSPVPDAPDETLEPAWTLLTHDRLLGERLYVQAQVRIVLAGVIVAGTVFGRFVVGVVELPWETLVGLGLAVGAYGAAALRVAASRRAPDPSGRSRRLLLNTMYAAIGLDYLALAVAITLVGGARSPFLPFFLLHAILSCLLLSRRAAIAFHFLAYGFVVALVLAEAAGILVPHLPRGAVAGTSDLDLRYAFALVVVYGFLFGVTAWLLLGFARMLRRGERRIRAANRELRRLSQLRRDFLSVAVHNLQAPVGVVTMLLENLRSELGGPVTEKQKDWISRCLARLSQLTKFMHDLRILSTLESGAVEAERVDVDVAALLEEVVAAHLELADAKGQALDLSLPGDLPPVRGLEILLREAVANYLTNAVKYTPEGGHIRVRARHEPPWVRIDVEDDGIGIPAEEQERLFEDFVRLGKKTEKESGTGLGLSIVKRVAHAHGGRIRVESREGEGSRFGLDLPAAGVSSPPSPAASSG